MNEVQNPKKPFYYYYGIVFIFIFLFNALLLPQLAKQAIKEVDYGTFMQMTYDREIGEVEIQDNQILFTDKGGTAVYKTGLVQDPGLTERLYTNGVVFSSEIVEEMPPLMSFFVGWILPMIIFIGIGQLLSRQMMKKMGGGNSMMFGMGGSKAKVYVKSSQGIHFRT